MNEYDFGYNQPVNNKNVCLKKHMGTQIIEFVLKYISYFYNVYY